MIVVIQLGHGTSERIQPVSDLFSAYIHHVRRSIDEEQLPEICGTPEVTREIYSPRYWTVTIGTLS